jgi:hypothetical protein
VKAVSLTGWAKAEGQEKIAKQSKERITDWKFMDDILRFDRVIPEKN